MKVDLGHIDDLPDDHCIAVADGRAIAIRTAEGPVVFPNRCLHQNSPLADGRVFDGKLTCPLHFWRYHLPSGAHVGGRGSLERYRVQVHDGQVSVDLPEPEPEMGMRERLLAHAREWERDR
ncbi:Rieske (2Fe-2S) protein [Euzebya tangerina]|uniref:Rieske (2Fe-2S) protein n=1 Tax=Euzebya tangerina TaxID=591198 RepID=UPI000E319697|nr:Rieske 2Fe-2S domain-containing protein [Euzebya tangerina]